MKNTRASRLTLAQTIVFLFALFAATVAFAGPCGTAVSPPWTAASSEAGIFPVTITHSVSGPPLTAFTWAGPPFAATTNAIGTATVTFTTYNGTVNASGTFTSGATSFPADYCKPVVSTIVYYFGDLVSTLFKSPADIQFTSSLTQVGSNLWQITDTVSNLQSTSVDFDWTAANFTGSLAGYSSTSKTLYSNGGAIEIVGSTSFMLEGTSVLMPADAWSPAPEPSSLFLLGSGVVGLSGLMRRRLAAQSSGAASSGR
jgi:hypothetical protein